MYYTDDPHADFDRYDRDQEAALRNLPICCNCQEHIQSEDLYDIDGSLYCEDCMEGFKSCTDNYISE